MCSDFAISISNVNKRHYNRSETFGAQIRIRSGARNGLKQGFESSESI